MHKVAVWGVGGVGGYYGGVLAARSPATSQVRVHFIARSHTLHQLTHEGLRITSALKGDIHLKPDEYEATDDAHTVGVADVVIVGVKGQTALLSILPDLHHLIGPHTIVLPLQNGLDTPEILAETIGKAHVLGGYCKIVSRIKTPGHIMHDSVDPVVGFGELWSSASKSDASESDGASSATLGGPSERVLQLKKLFEEAGVIVETPADVRVAMWQKLMLISSISGIGALSRSPIGTYMIIPELSEQVLVALLEVASVARGHGVALTDETALSVHAFLCNVAKAAPNSTSSLMRDIVKGVPSELEWQSGLVVRKAKEVGISVPTHALLYAALLPQELKARGEISYMDAGSLDDL